MTDADDEATTVFLRLVGRRVRDSRLAAGLTQSTLEHDAGLRPVTVSKLERGELDVTVDDLRRIADTLRVSLTALAAHQRRSGLTSACG